MGGDVGRDTGVIQVWARRGPGVAPMGIDPHGSHTGVSPWSPRGHTGEVPGRLGGGTECPLRRRRERKRSIPASGGRASDIVAQISNLPYRRIAFCRACVRSKRQQAFGTLPITNRRYGRLEICATLSTAVPMVGCAQKNGLGRGGLIATLFGMASGLEKDSYRLIARHRVLAMVPPPVPVRDLEETPPSFEALWQD